MLPFEGFGYRVAKIGPKFILDACYSAGTDSRRVDYEEDHMNLTVSEIIIILIFLGLPMVAVGVFSLRYRTSVLIAAILVIGSFLLVKLFPAREEASRYATYQMGQAIEDAAGRNAPADPRLRDSLIWDKLPSAIGTIFGLGTCALTLGAVFWAPGVLFRKLRRGRGGTATP